MYLTPAQLIDGPEAATEYAQLFGVDVALLVAAIGQRATTAWPVDDVARAIDAIASMERFIVKAEGVVNARLAHRGYPLPQDAQRFPVLAVWTHDIARYFLNLNRDRTSEETGRIERDYREALRELDQVAHGKLSLGAGDPLAPTPPDAADQATGAVRVQGKQRLFSREALGGL